MAKLKKETFKFNGTKWEIFSKDTGDLPIAENKTENVELLERVITVHNYYEDNSEEPKDSYFNNENTFVRDFRGNGKLFRMLLTPQETAPFDFFNRLHMLQRCNFKNKWKSKREYINSGKFG